MESLERAHSLFLSSHVSTPSETRIHREDGTQNANRTYLHDLEEHDKKLKEAARDSGERDGRPSRTSTIRAVEDFFKEYNPPSFKLKRLSDLDKALPLPPPDPEPGDDPLDKRCVSDRLEYTRANIAIHNCYTARTPSTGSGLRPGSNVTRASIRSRYSAQTTKSNRISDVSFEDEWPKPDRKLSVASDKSRVYPRKQSRGSVRYWKTLLEGVSEETEQHKEREANRMIATEKDPWLLEHAHGSLESDNIVLGTRGKGIGALGEGGLIMSDSGVKKIVRTSSDVFASFYNQCASALESRKDASARRKRSRTSEIRPDGLFAGCFWSRDGRFDDVI